MCNSTNYSFAFYYGAYFQRIMTQMKLAMKCLFSGFLYPPSLSVCLSVSSYIRFLSLSSACINSPFLSSCVCCSHSQCYLCIWFDFMHVRAKIFTCFHARMYGTEAAGENMRKNKNTYPTGLICMD